MNYAHSYGSGVLHRDLKPPNVLFVGDEPRISDFGLGKEIGSDSTTITHTAAVMGTAPYMAPEQFDDMKRVGKPADVYALGKILCEMFTGTRPPTLRIDLSGVPPEFHYFISRCCADDPDDRYPDAGEAALEFDILTAAPPEAIDPPLLAAEKLVQEWTQATDDASRSAVLGRLDEHLARNTGEEQLYFQVVPRLPPELVSSYIAELPDAFRRMLSVYDKHIAGGLPFDYCDLVANLYARVWAEDSDVNLRRMMLARLIDMGASQCCRTP